MHNEIREQLALEMSKRNINIVTEHILTKPAQFPILFELIFDQNIIIARRAAWATEHCFLQQKELLQPYLERIIKTLPTLSNSSIARHFLKILSLSNIHQLLTGELINLCFQWLTSELQPIAVKIFAMDVLYNATQTYPELSNELITSIDLILPNASAGTKNKGKKLIARLKKENRKLV